MSRSRATRRPILPLLLALAACASALLAWRAVPALARSSRAASCGSHAGGAHRPSACAGSARSTRAHGKAKRHHRKSSVHSRKKRTTPSGSTAHIPAPAPTLASCEDGSIPTHGPEGAYECADGSEPECANGAEPASRRGARPVCPVAATPDAGESSEAVCDDASVPTSVEGSYVCEDGSSPECEDGSPPVAGAEGSPPACSVPGTDPSPDGEAGEDGEEADSEGSFGPPSARVAIGS